MPISNEQAMELVKFLNLNEVENLDDAKEKFSTAWVKAEELNEKLGKINGTIANVTRKAFEPFGVVLTDEDFKDKKVQDVIRSASDKARETFENQKEEWEKRASGNGSESLIKEWESKYKSLEKKHLEIDSARQDVVNQFESYKNKVKEDAKINTINSIFEKELNSIKLDPSTNEFTIRGFKSLINDKYEIDIEENGNAIVKDKQSGERLKSTAKAGTFLNVSDILIKEATDAGIIQKNPYAGKIVTNKPVGQIINNNQNDVKTKTVNPKFLGI